MAVFAPRVWNVQRIECLGCVLAQLPQAIELIDCLDAARMCARQQHLCELWPLIRGINEFTSILHAENQAYPALVGKRVKTLKKLAGNFHFVVIRFLKCLAVEGVPEVAGVRSKNAMETV